MQTRAQTIYLLFKHVWVFEIWEHLNIKSYQRQLELENSSDPIE